LEWRTFPAQAWTLFPCDAMWELCLWQRHCGYDREVFCLILIRINQGTIDSPINRCGCSSRWDFQNASWPFGIKLGFSLPKSSSVSEMNCAWLLENRIILLIPI
jgi:hypothetical protein